MTHPDCELLTEQVFDDRVAHCAGFDADPIVGLEPVAQRSMTGRVIGHGEVIDSVTGLVQYSHVEIGCVGIDARVTRHGGHVLQARAPT